MVDNIMDPHYVDELFKPLSEECNDYRIFYEVKANLTPAQLRTMSKAGVDHIQPGIESLSTHILSLMRKGITMLRNVRLLKWAHYYGMRVQWNLLTGFPGETEADYTEQRRIIPLLRHLPPPDGSWPVWLERFSPYFFDPVFHLGDVRPRTAYEHIYPNSIDKLKVAYFFECDMGSILSAEQHRELYSELIAWQNSWKQSVVPRLLYRRTPDWIEIIDKRQSMAQRHRFYDREALIYEFCSETDHTIGAVCQHLKEGCVKDEEILSEVSHALQTYCNLGLMLEESGHYLSLAIPVNPNR